jgi:hypothetical protein
VLDDDDGDAALMDAPDQGNRVLHLGRRQPGHRLVEQQHLGLGGKRPGDLQAACGPGVPRLPGRRIDDVAEPDALQAPSRALARASCALGWRSSAPIVALSSTDIDSK